MINGVRPDEEFKSFDWISQRLSAAVSQIEVRQWVSGTATPVMVPAVCIGRMALWKEASYNHLYTILLAARVCWQMPSKVRSQQHDNMDTITGNTTTPFIVVKTV
jgi:hypothetical protein